MKIFGTHDDNTIEQFREVAKRAVHSVLCADGHFGYIMPVGGVAAYRNEVTISGVGYDIACGNCAAMTNLRLADLADLSAIADEIQATISFGVGRKNNATDAPVGHPLFSDPLWDSLPDNVRTPLRDKAMDQLGTVGSGNHYVDVFVDDSERVWVGVHFGSRGFGHTIASGFLALSANEQWGARVKEHDGLVSLDTPLGQDYFGLMELAGEYAYAGREWVTRKVVDILGGTIESLVHNNHNYAWRELHFGEELVVVRKGSTPAFPGQLGFVGGSMGDDSVILSGAVNQDARAAQEQALFSTVHGAGRVMSRTEAKGKRSKSGEIKKVGRVTPAEMTEWLTRKGVVLRGGDLDESPHAYRRLDAVLEAHSETIEILHVLHPVVVVMAGGNEFDPYKD